MNPPLSHATNKGVFIYDLSAQHLPALVLAAFLLTLPDTPELLHAADLLPVHVGLRAAVEGGRVVHPTLVAVNTLSALSLAVNTRQGGGQVGGHARVVAGVTGATKAAGATGA